MYRPFPRNTFAVCFYNECTVISDKKGFIGGIVDLDFRCTLYLNCTIVHPPAVVINLDVAL